MKLFVDGKQIEVDNDIKIIWESELNVWNDRPEEECEFHLTARYDGVTLDVVADGEITDSAAMPLIDLLPPAKTAEPNGWVYLLNDDVEEDDKPQFFITPYKFWRETGYINDNDTQNFPKLPDEFRHCSEACWEYEGEGCPYTILESLGFKDAEEIKGF